MKGIAQRIHDKCHINLFRDSSALLHRQTWLTVSYFNTKHPIDYTHPVYLALSKWTMLSQMRSPASSDRQGKYFVTFAKLEHSK